MSQAEPNHPPSQNEEFDHTLRELERSLVALKTRYKEVQEAQQRQNELQQGLQDKQAPYPELERELQTIQDELQQLSLTLESNLLSDGDVKTLFWEGVRRGLLGEMFWQIIRFGGLGVLIGWLLKTWAN
jgi:predicted RNase H-like nuclease (RuvC/YqgF family)